MSIMTNDRGSMTAVCLIRKLRDYIQLTKRKEGEQTREGGCAEMAKIMDPLKGSMEI